MSLISMAYQAYLVRRIGSAGIGLYELVMSVSFLCITLAVSGGRFAATRLVSEELGRGEFAVRGAMSRCIGYGVFFGLCAFCVLYFSAEPIGFLWIGDARTVLSLRIASFSMPFISVCAVLSGYFTACGRVWKSALVHLIEQLIAVCAVSYFLSRADAGDLEQSCAAIMRGSLLSDAAAFILLLLFYLSDRCGELSSGRGLTKRLLSIALPLAASSYARSALSTLEHILVPRGLKASGISSEGALAGYGTVQGMVLPLISFPACVLSALSELIVPELTACEVRGEWDEIRRGVKGIIKKGLGYSSAAALVLFLFSGPLSEAVYSSAEAGHYVRLLSPLIPIMYTDMLVDGCLKGLGQQVYSMGINILDALLGAVLVWFILPIGAMKAYIAIIYFNECLNFSLSALRLRSTLTLHRACEAPWKCSCRL